jgi:hypothetical protein
MMIPTALAWGALAVALCAGANPQDRLAVEHASPEDLSHPLLMTRKPDGALRVLVGGRIGAGSTLKEAFVADLVESAGVDAIAVGYEDLSARGQDRRALLSAEKIPFVCANVKGAGRAYVVRSVGGKRMAFLGVTKVPGYRKDFELGRGWEIRDPVASVRALLPELAKEADFVVLLAVMDRQDCAELVRAVPSIPLALVAAPSAMDSEPLTLGDTVLVQSGTGTACVSRTMIETQGKKVTAVSNRMESIEISDADRARSRALRSKHQEGVDLKRLLAGVELAPPAGVPKETGPLTSLHPGDPQPLVVRRSDESVEIRIESLQLATERGGRKAPLGFAWLVLRSAWKNQIPLNKEGLPTAFSVADASQNLYVVANGRTLSRMEVDLSGGPEGLLTGRSIYAGRMGDVRRGDLVFPVPARVERLDLHFHDFRKAPAILSLLADPQGGEAKPIGGTSRNDLLEVGVFGLRREAVLGERKAPEGKSYVLVDVRARSTATLMVERVEIGVAGDMPEFRRSLSLTTDRGETVSPCEGGDLPEEPRFISSAFTGGGVAFLIPESSRPGALRCDLGEFELPNGRRVKPGPFTISLDGKAPARQFCPQCGQPADPGDKFCGKCGSKLVP